MYKCRKREFLFRSEIYDLDLGEIGKTCNVAFAFMAWGVLVLPTGKFEFQLIN